MVPAPVSCHHFTSQRVVGAVGWSVTRAVRARLFAAGKETTRGYRPTMSGIDAASNDQGVICRRRVARLNASAD